MGGEVMKGVDSKRVYLVCYEAEKPPKWLTWFLQFGWIERLWRIHCFKKINKLSAGEVMNKYYEVTDHVK
jgi:hypothetical protein